MTMTLPQIERILLQLKFTLASKRGTPEARSLLALNQVNNALRDQALHIRHTDLDQPVREDNGDVLLA